MFDFRSARARLRNYSGEVVHMPLSPCIDQWAVTLCSWEGNRRSAFAPAMQYKLQGLKAKESEISILLTLYSRSTF